jgi:glycosyltransferase involved in cell wall biosynthesis
LAPGEQNLAYLNSCIDLANGLPVSFHLDAAAHELQTLVQSSSIYWHGAGLNVDTIENPELCEHFGISLVEAMGAGNIPLVVGNGGPDEIVEFGLDGFKYQSIEGLIRRTSILFDLSPRSQATLRGNARAKFDKYFRSGFDNQWTSVGTLLQK